MENENEITIRAARMHDIPQMLELLSQVNRLHHEGRPDLFKVGTKYDAVALQEMIADAERPVLVAADGTDRCVGYAMCQLRHTAGSRLLHPVTTLYIDDLCVSAALRGHGIGRRLYNAALCLARRSGCHSVTLNVWECNPAARRFYERLGMHTQKSTMEALL